MGEPTPPIGSQISALAELAPDAPAVTCDGRTLTRAELDATTNRLARAYQELGVGVGDYVTIVLPNSIEWIAGDHCVLEAGRGPAAVVRTAAGRRVRGTPGVAAVGAGGRPGGSARQITKCAHWFHTRSGTVRCAATGSGFAGMEGGGLGRQHGSAQADRGRRRQPDARQQSDRTLGAQEGDVQLVSVPMSHSTGFNWATAGLLMGHHLVLMPHFEAKEFLRLVTEHRVTFLATVPTVMQRLLPVYRADPDAFDLSSIRVFWHMAAPCPPAVKQAWIELLGPEVVWELYTGSELQAVTFITGDQWLTHRGSVGPVVAGEMKVLDDDGRECAPGEVGEIYMRPTPGDAPTYRYVGATAKTRDGWDSLGDLGYFDEDGYLYLSDRRVDMFTVGGRNVYPAEIESALSAHPDVLSCLVVGVPHEDLGQVPYALVQAARSPEAAALDEATVTEFLRERIAGYKVPQTVEFVDSPLRDDAGKARRSAVRAEIIARLQARASR